MQWWWNEFHGIYQWSAEEDVEGYVKINYVEHYFLSSKPNSNGQQDSPFCGSFQVIIGLGSDDNYDVYLNVSYLFNEP